MTPIASRIRLITISESRNSIGFSGLIMRLPRLRAHISSRKEMEKPSWPRNRMSQRMTAPISVPPARAKKLAFCAMYIWRKPQVMICSAGQYSSSSSRGQDDIRRYQ